MKGSPTFASHTLVHGSFILMKGFSDKLEHKSLSLSLRNLGTGPHRDTENPLGHSTTRNEREDSHESSAGLHDLSLQNICHLSRQTGR